MTQRAVTVLAVALVALAGADQVLRGAGHPGQATPSTDIRATVERYCRLDAAGARLTAEGRKELAKFVTPVDMTMPREVALIRTFSVADPVTLTDRRARIGIDYTHLGFLETATARLRLEAPGLWEKEVVTLSRSDAAWKIDGPLQWSFVTVAATRVYVTRLRAQTTDPAVKRNADRTLAALKRLR